MNKDTPLFRYYSSITELPLRNYRDVVVRGNLLALVISGEPPREELEAAWMDIQQQYADAMEDFEYKSYLTMIKDIGVLNVTYRQVHIAVQQLSIIVPIYLAEPSEEIYIKAIEVYRNDLNKTLRSNFDFTDPGTYQNQLQRCINRSKGEKLRLDKLIIDSEAMREKFERGKKPDDAYFLSILTTLSDHAGYRLTDEITVYEFADRLRRLQKQASNK